MSDIIAVPSTWNTPNDIRKLLEEVGCWPPTCHACGEKIAADEHISFKSPPVEVFAGSGPGMKLLCLIHARCEEKEVAQPEKAERGQGAYLTLDDFKQYVSLRYMICEIKVLGSMLLVLFVVLWALFSLAGCRAPEAQTHKDICKCVKSGAGACCARCKNVDKCCCKHIDRCPCPPDTRIP